jgi:hypothetical protein
MKSSLLPPVIPLVSCLTYFSALKMQATCSSETSVNLQWTSLRYIPEDRNLQVGFFSYSFVVHHQASCLAAMYSIYILACMHSGEVSDSILRWITGYCDRGFLQSLQPNSGTLSPKRPLLHPCISLLIHSL